MFYLVAKGGTPKVAEVKGANDAIALMALLGNSLPQKVTINELTTVASAYTAAQFIHGDSISGNALGLRIAAGNAPNLVDPATGGWGEVLLDPINSAENTTLVNLNNTNALTAQPPFGPTSTWGAGNGITVIYGIASPVKAPLIGQARKP